MIPAGNLITVEQQSPCLGRPASFDVFVPAREAPAEGWPVLYLLHGAFGGFKDWTVNTSVEEVADEAGVMLVLPDGSQFGWYVDSPHNPQSQYETRVIGEIIPFVDNTFNTRKDRLGRGICGLSMGGHGAISLATKHPQLFGSASSLSGIMALQNHVDRWQILNCMGGMENSPEFWNANSCLNIAPRLKGAAIELLLDCGVEDEQTGAIGDNRAFHQCLMELGVPHTYHEYPGGHTWHYWSDHIAEHVQFHADVFRRPH